MPAMYTFSNYPPEGMSSRSMMSSGEDTNSFRGGSRSSLRSAESDSVRGEASIRSSDSLRGSIRSESTDDSRRRQQERNQKIRKRKEEWKKVLNEGKATKSTRHSNISNDRPSIQIHRRSKFMMNDYDDDDDDNTDDERLIKGGRNRKTIPKAKVVAEELRESKSTRDLKARRLRGEVVHAAKRSVKEVDGVDEATAVEALRKAREVKELEERRAKELAEREEASKTARLNKARLLELEMAAPPVVVLPEEPKFVEIDMSPVRQRAPSPPPPPPRTPPPPIALVPKKRRKKSVKQPKKKSKDLLDAIVEKILSAACCAGNEVDFGLDGEDIIELAPPQ